MPGMDVLIHLWIPDDIPCKEFLFENYDYEGGSDEDNFLKECGDKCWDELSDQQKDKVKEYYFSDVMWNGIKDFEYEIRMV